MPNPEHKHAPLSSQPASDDAQSHAMNHNMHDAHAGHNMPGHSMPGMPMAGANNEMDAGHSEHNGHAHHADHTGHEQMFRSRFWGSLLLSIPVLAFSAAVQQWLRFGVPSFAGSNWIPFVFALIVFVYGGIPFIRMAIPEILDREPGMMTLISLAISVSLLYSLAAQIFGLGEGFFWELVTLIDIMLLGHWLEMRSIRQASGAVNKLAKLYAGYCRIGVYRRHYPSGRNPYAEVG